MNEPILSIFHAGSERWTDKPYSWDNAKRDCEPAIGVIQRTVRGEGFFEVGGVQKSVPEGTFMLFCHGENSRYWASCSENNPFLVEYIAISGHQVLDFFQYLRLRLGDVFRLPDRSESDLQFCDLLSRYQRQALGDRFQLSTRLYQLLLSLMKFGAEGGMGGNPIEQAHSFIRDQFRTPITQDNVADHVGMSREHLCRAYRARYGVSPGRACRHLRLEHARDLLKGTNASVEQIALNCGYLDVTSFTRAFSQTTGVSPLVYRRQARSTESR